MSSLLTSHSSHRPITSLFLLALLLSLCVVCCSSVAPPAQAQASVTDTEPSTLDMEELAYKAPFNDAAAQQFLHAHNLPDNTDVHLMVSQLISSAEEQRFGVLSESSTPPHPPNPWAHPHHASLYLSSAAEKLIDIDAALTMYEDAATMGSSAAMHAIGEIYLFGEGGLSPNYTLAESYFNASAELGNAEAQHYLAVMASLGITKQRDDQVAVLYEYFSASGGNILAQMALGYRHMNGVNTPISCDSAYNYYELVAKQTVKESINSPVNIILEKARLQDERTRSMAAEEDEDVVQYLQHSAENGDVSAQVALGHLYFYGARGFEHQPEKAARYFRAAAKQGDMSAVATLGQMHIQGLGVPQNNETALAMLKEAADAKNPSAQNGLGYLFLHGQGTPQDYMTALKWFKLAAEQGNAEAQFNLGAMYFAGLGVDKKYATALQYFTMASHQHHTRALYNLGHMHYHGLGTMKSCAIAVKYLKTIAERGSWSLLMNEAHRNFLKGHYETAWMQYARAAEEGYEVAQLNSAWMLHEGYGFQATQPNRYEIAYRHLQMASRQGNVESLRLLGDYAFAGLASGTIDHKLAASFYTKAAELRNAQSMFNLGYMHVHGLGVQVDYHLGKRYFDQAIEAEPDAYVPAKLALLALQAQQWWELVQVWWNNGITPPADANANNAAAAAAAASNNAAAQQHHKQAAPQSTATHSFSQSLSIFISTFDYHPLLSWFSHHYVRLFTNNQTLTYYELFLKFEDIILAILCGMLAMVVYLKSQRR